jgi:TM2 domain-containing membrane protein YozV
MTTRFCLICIFLCVTCFSKAQNRWLSRADSLLAQKAFFEASVAYERVLFNNESPQINFRAALGKTQCLKQQSLFANAATFLNGQLAASYPDSLLFRLRYEQILCAYLAGQFENTLSNIQQLTYLYPNQSKPPILAVIQILSLNELQRWPEADAAYQQLLARQGVDTTQQSPYQQLPKLKSEKKAQWLSTFLPGGGQFYAGKPGEALLSIAVQGAGLYFGIASFLQGYYISAWGIGAGLFGSFHMGGVRRAEVLVQQHNQKKINTFNQRVKTQLLEKVRP